MIHFIDIFHYHKRKPTSNKYDINDFWNDKYCFDESEVTDLKRVPFGPVSAIIRNDPTPHLNRSYSKAWTYMGYVNYHPITKELQNKFKLPQSFLITSFELGPWNEELFEELSLQYKNL